MDSISSTFLDGCGATTFPSKGDTGLIKALKTSDDWFRDPRYTSSPEQRLRTADLALEAYFKDVLSLEELFITQAVLEVLYPRVRAESPIGATRPLYHKIGATGPIYYKLRIRVLSPDEIAAYLEEYDFPPFNADACSRLHVTSDDKIRAAKETIIREWKGRSPLMRTVIEVDCPGTIAKSTGTKIHPQTHMVSYAVFSPQFTTDLLQTTSTDAPINLDSAIARSWRVTSKWMYKISALSILHKIQREIDKNYCVALIKRNLEEALAAANAMDNPFPRLATIVEFLLENNRDEEAWESIARTTGLSPIRKEDLYCLYANKQANKKDLTRFLQAFENIKDLNLQNTVMDPLITSYHLRYDRHNRRLPELLTAITTSELSPDAQDRCLHALMKNLCGSQEQTSLILAKVHNKAGLSGRE